ncbi:MAG TPA: response regulator [Kofleriaceae bacterium]|nr:response regulator [Kofleriaceae bacterium]
MRRRVERVIMTLAVELTVGGEVIRTATQDVSPFGMFVRIDRSIPVGTEVELAIAPRGARLTAPGIVVHALEEAEAQALGRKPGVGVLFRGARPGEPGAQLAAEVIRLIENHVAAASGGEDLRIVIADPSTRLLERLSTALGNAGFSVAIVTNGLEALGAALTRTPDVVLAERDMPVLDGMQLLSEMGQHAELAGVPVMIMSEQSSDLARLEAFQLGAMDFVPKPFTALEVILRARRLAKSARREGAERVILRGRVDAVGLPMLLSMLEQDRKTGVLTMTNAEVVAWLWFTDGKLVRVRASDVRGDSRSTLMRVLDWNEGHFELSVGSAEGPRELEDSVTHLLLEHARMRDEAARVTARS